MMVDTTKRYELKVYDHLLVAFTASTDSFGTVSLCIDECDESHRRLFPLALIDDTTPQALLTWLESRVIPKNRRFVDQILAQAGLTAGDTLGIIDLCLGLSLNDAYWVVPSAFDGRYADYNLFDNDMDEALALVAYTGYTSTQHQRAGLSSEWTTDGQYPKAWRKIGSDIFLYKAGTEGYANSGMEPFSEYFAAQTAQAFGVTHIAYDLDEWHGKLASTCKLMHDKDTAFVSFWQATGQSRFPANLEAARRISSECFEAMRDMLVFDALVCNTDRHANNYGFLRDNATGALLRFAPLFDHNLSLFPGDMENDFPQWTEKAGRLIPAGSNLSFDDLVAHIIAKRHHEALRSMLTFKLKNHPAYPVPETRLEALNGYLHTRVQQLLRIEPIATEQLVASIQESLPGDARIPACRAL